MNLIIQLKYLFLLCFLIKIYHFQPNSPDMNVICFSNDDFIFDNNEYKNIESYCLQKGGYLKKGQREPSYDYKGNIILENKTYCCNIKCGINGIIVGSSCKWNEDKSFCNLTSNLYYVNPISIFGPHYCDISFDLLYDIYNLFNFNLYCNLVMTSLEKYCTFKSREDLLINFANQIDHKFIYSWGGGHKHFDQRLMDTSEGRDLMETPFLI